MMPLSRRYIPHLLALLFPVLIPVLAHSYRRFHADDCRNPSGLFPTSPDRQDEGKSRQMREAFEAIDWREGALGANDPRLRFDFAIIRSYDPKKLYHHPENSFVRDAAPDSRAVEWLTNSSEKVPIHRAYYEGGGSAIVVAYLLVYDSRPVANPYLAQLSSFPLQLVTGRLPMTIFFVSARGPRGEFRAMEEHGRKWLLASWEKYSAACTQKAGDSAPAAAQ